MAFCSGVAAGDRIPAIIVGILISFLIYVPTARANTLDFLTVTNPYFNLILIILLLSLLVFALIWRKKTRQRRKELEHELKNQQVWFKSLLASVPDATLIADEDGIIVELNNRAEILFGGNRQQLLGESIETFVPEDLRSKHTLHRKAFVLSSAPREMGVGMPLSARKLNGVLFPVEISLSIINSDTKTFVAASIRDVSAQNRELEDLANREEWMRSILESAPDAMVVVDEEGTIVRVNRQTEILFNYGRENLLGKSVDMLVPDEIREQHASLRNMFVRATAPREMGAAAKLNGRKANGQVFPVEISLSPIEIDGEHFVAAAVRDITLRREREKVIAAKEAQLNAALDNMSCGIMMVDKDMVIRVLNDRYTDLYRVREAKIGMPLRTVTSLRAERGELGEGDVDQLVEQRLNEYRSREVVRGEDTVLGKFVIEYVRVPTSDGGVVCIFNDITERKAAETALAEKSKKLADLAESLSRYLSPQIYESIFHGDQQVSIRTERKKLSIFFSDIVNFTATTESLEAEDITFLLNDYLTKMTEIALAHGGTIDKYIGDAILVFFGDPESKGVKEDATACVRMAIDMQRRMVDLRAKWKDMGYDSPFQIRCGVNTAYCNVGNFGSDQRMDYTVIGAQVNLASRLETSCDPDGVVVSDATYRLVQEEFDATAMEPITVKGVRDPVTPYSLTGVFDGWNEEERYIRREVHGLRIWVDLAHMSETQRVESVSEIKDALRILEEIGANLENPVSAGSLMVDVSPDASDDPDDPDDTGENPPN